MRMLLTVEFPHEPFNSIVRKGVIGETMGRVLETMQAESVYFTEQDGRRGAVMIVNVADPSEIPKLAEPWFLTFNADCRFRIAMTIEDLQRANLQQFAGE
jgi:hypothetical protein